MFSLIFVCTGNTCRSPLAAVIARRLLAGEPIDIGSAGVATSGGQPASNHSIFVAGERGEDLRSHRSRSLTPELADRTDLVVTMTRGHRDEVRRRHPQLAGRVMTLGELSAVGGDPDVPDPFGGPLEQYEATYARLQELLEASLPGLRSRIQAKTSS